MLLKRLIFLNRTRLSAVLCCAFSICVTSFNGAAQDKPQPRRDILPRVGTIKDYPATGLATGCGNLYFYPASQAKDVNGEKYVFLARGDGSDAWMNLNGRDVRLLQTKSLTRVKGNPRRFYYRLGKLRVSVAIEALKPEREPVNEGDPMFKMTITIRKGRAVRTVRAVGGADC